MNKYEITNKVHPLHSHLRRIRALRDISRYGVRAGALGGYIQSEKNLAHEGDAWVGDVACVYSNASVSGDALVHGNASVSGDASVSGNAVVAGNASVSGNAIVSGDALVSGTAFVSGHALVSGHTVVQCSRFRRLRI